MSSITRLTMVAILLVLPAHVVGQPDDEVPRLPWGAPDLQGIWLYGTSTPLERPGEFGDKAVVTADWLVFPKNALPPSSPFAAQPRVSSSTC